MNDVRVCFMGTPEFAVPILDFLIANYNVVVVVSQPDALVGRNKVLTPSPIKSLASAHGIPVLTPTKIRNEYEELLNYKPDIIITCAYGQIVPKVILDYPTYGCINIHASLLPAYRGASPISAALQNGETETGITIMYMDETLDTGNIIAARAIDIALDDTLGTLSLKLSNLGRDLLRDTLPKIIAQTNFDIPQDDASATYAPLIKREDERIHFNSTAKKVYDFVRSLNPKPLANICLDGEEWKVLNTRIGDATNGEIGVISKIYKDGFAVNTCDREIIITRIKPAGKKEMNVQDFFNGYDAKKLLGKKLDL